MPTATDPHTRSSRPNRFLGLCRRWLAPLLALCLLGVPLAAQRPGGAAPAATIEQALAPRDVLGYWEMPEPEGDQCVVILKPGGRASCFWTGTSAQDFQSGRWELAPPGVLVTWASGHRDLFLAGDNLSLRRLAFPPGHDLSGEPAFETRAIRIDRRMMGSLTVDPSSPGAPRRDWGPRAGAAPESDAATGAEAEAEDEDPKIVFGFDPTTSVDEDALVDTGDGAERMELMRNAFLGFWAIEQDTGMLGIGGADTPQFYINIMRGGRARYTLRDGDGPAESLGRWQLREDGLELIWPHGTREFLAREGDGGYRLTELERRRGWLPFSLGGGGFEAPAKQVSADEAARFFTDAEVGVLSVNAIQGIWLAPDDGLQAQIEIERWNRATRMASDDLPRARGHWRIEQDQVLLRWDDGYVSVFRLTPRAYILELFPPGDIQSAATPLTTWRVVREEDAPAGRGAAVRR